MSKMKHLLRKLHIGGGGGAATNALSDDHHPHHHNHHQTRPVPNPNPSPTQSQPQSQHSLPSSSSSSSVATPAVDVGFDRTGNDFNFLEEEFQVQLALAISASAQSNSLGITDSETAQIDAAKRISLNQNHAVDLLSLRYWSCNVVDYSDKVMDGFYDVYGITSSLVMQGKMPMLVDLRTISVSDNVDYEVILVNRLVDTELQALEKRAYNIYLECQAYACGPVLSGLIQKIADIVVERMGGPVGDAYEMLERWTSRSYELRNSLNSIILPLGCLDVGLSRHRALLFKVLADRINLPCMMVKGSYYTGTDDGAVNFIKIDDGSEYIIDLMGAPGTLIPAEVPTSHLSNLGLGLTGLADFTEASKSSCLLLDNGAGSVGVLPMMDENPKVSSSRLEATIVVGRETNKDVRNLSSGNQTERFEHEFESLLAPTNKLGESSSSTTGKLSAQTMKVNDVSKYVINAAKNPEFAQKLHAVLLESGASPPLDLFVDIGQQDHVKERMLEQVHQENGKYVKDGFNSHPNKFLSSHENCVSAAVGVQFVGKVRCDNKQKQFDEGLVQQGELATNTINSDGSSPDATTGGFVLVGNGSNEPIKASATGIDMFHENSPTMVARALHEKQTHEYSVNPAVGSSQGQLEDSIIIDDRPTGRIFKYTDFGGISSGDLMEMANNGQHSSCNGHDEKVNPILGGIAEILWEDLQIFERIGIGSYGEVYRADLNGTEVAVKKFLDQDFSGDALVQFKCEVEIMLRLRHPNVVLFMGAVTRLPNFSIVTEFLPRGSLYRLLHRPNPLLDKKRRMRMALDVAKGMNYLHTSNPTIVHRDLKTPNLLVDKNWIVKVCDFGLSRMKHHTFLSSKSTAGTPEWMAPEVLRNEPANEKCDVYSFGVILWELATLQIPWKGLNPMQVVGAVGFQNRRLEIPEDVHPAVAEIIRDCWQSEPHFRPSFAQLMSRLRRLQRVFVDRTNSSNQTVESTVE